ncbi:MAG: hypothetical protein ONB16_10705 [candidate division KSB1 bacterium]|nr:hypothetical protein [candidate division KSB1 bacterium]MDZ7319111.1 hypothetical protein [candidate division KSB1 bacterium]MDZ7341510.1 hypothetical protein [candidate division KSB1 bacterium]
MKSNRMYPVSFVIVAIAACFLLAQCYTTFRHPILYSTADSLATPQPQEITFMDNCSNCHDQAHPLTHSPIIFQGEPIDDYNYSWQYFYTMPWWLDSYYYENQPANLEDRLPPTERRNFDRREVPPSSAIENPAVSAPSLSKPAGQEQPQSPAVAPPPPQRHERRQISTSESNKIERPATPPAQEKKQVDPPKKKEKD